MKTKISHSKIFVKNYLFIDGISRTGKMLLSRIIPTLNKFEQVEYVEFIEYILAALHLKKIGFDFANSFIIQTLNEMSYNKYIGRKQNIKPGDVTNVKNFYKDKIYKNRLNSPEGLKAINLVKKSRNYFPLMSHDIMAHFQNFKKIDLNYKVIQIYRNPFDVIYSWYKRGWGTRFQTDPQPVGLLLKNNNKHYPWYVEKKEKVWQNMNSVERCAFIVINITRKSINNHKSEKKNKKILTLTYEDFIQNTQKNINKICKFLNTTTTLNTKKALKKEKCPKDYNYENTLKKKIFIKSRVTLKTYNSICKLEKKYKKNLYNLI